MSESRLEVCRLQECHNLFIKAVHNQTFCSKDCCRVFTNARILAAYHEKKNRTMTGRVCKDPSCATILSRYNDDSFCASHQQQKHIDKLKGWGWEVDEDGVVGLPGW